MSQTPLLSVPVIEWSPAGAVAFDPATKQYHRGPISTFAGSLSQREVVLAIGRRSAFVRAVRMPDAPRAEIGQILAMQIGQYFPVAAGELAYDFRITPDKNEEGRLVVVAAVGTDLLRIALSELKSSGLRPKIIVPAAFGSWLVAQSGGKDTCAVVEPTAEGLAIDVIADGELRYSRVGPPAANEEEVEAEISRTFSVAGISGGEVLAAGGLTFGRANVRLPAPTLEGFAMAGAERIALSIELPETRVDRERRKRAQRVRMIAMLVLAAIGVWSFVFIDNARQARREDRIRRNWTSRITKAKNLTKAAEATTARQKRIADSLKVAFRPAQQFSDVLTVAGNMAPGSIWLTGATLDRGRPVSLRGTAVSSEAVASYLQRLSQDARFRDVKLVFANNATIEDKPVVQFSVSAHAVGNLPLAEKKMVAKK